MNMQSVSSSQIAAIGYDEETSKLNVQFHNGSTYEYEDVPLDTYEELLSAGSVGSYFSSNVKNSFTYRRV